MVAKELTISDSEHSDAEVSYTENGIFNLSRGQTPLTEGSEGERTWVLSGTCGLLSIGNFSAVRYLVFSI